MFVGEAKKLMRICSLRNLSTTSSRTFRQSALMGERKKDEVEIRYRKVCPDSKVLECKKTKPKVKENPCKEPGKDGKDGKSPPPAFNSMWDTYVGKKYAKPVVEWDFPKECCPQCETFRFDVLYYTPSKKSRAYQRTWWECVPRMVPKRVCCQCDANPPEIERRTRALQDKRPENACSNAKSDSDRLECLNKTFQDCQRLKMPCCRAARIPPLCKIFPHPSDCEKTKCPFPSYSECMQEEPAVIPGRSRECTCLEYNPICIRLRRAQHMADNNISIFPCERGERKK